MNGLMPGTGRFTPAGSGGAGTAGRGNRIADCAADTFLPVPRYRPPTSPTAATARVVPDATRTDRRAAVLPPRARACAADGGTLAPGGTFGAYGAGLRAAPGRSGGCSFPASPVHGRSGAPRPPAPRGPGLAGTAAPPRRGAG